MSLNRFRWVVCQFDRLRRNFPSSIRRILADLPESLDETYEQTLWGSIRRNEYMHSVYSVASRCLFALFALKSLRRFLPLSQTRQRYPHLTKICGHQMRKKRCCQRARVSSPLSIGKAVKLF